MARFNGTVDEDQFSLTRDERDVARMRGGDDYVYLSRGSLDSNDRIDGGDGFLDTVVFSSGKYEITGATMKNFEWFDLSRAGRFNVSVDDAVAADGQFFRVDAYLGTQLWFDGSAERAAEFSITGTNGDDRILGGGGRDDIEGRAGDDVLSGGGAGDIFRFGGDVATGDAWGDDVIRDFDPDADVIAFTTKLASSFDDLELQNVSGGVLVSLTGAESSVMLRGVKAADLNANDFTFSSGDGFVRGHDATPTIDHSLLV